MQQFWTSPMAWHSVRPKFSGSDGNGHCVARWYQWIYYDIHFWSWCTAFKESDGKNSQPGTPSLQGTELDGKNSQPGTPSLQGTELQ